jgi:hypothetical protein
MIKFFVSGNKFLDHLESNNFVSEGAGRAGVI